MTILPLLLHEPSKSESEPFPKTSGQIFNRLNGRNLIAMSRSDYFHEHQLSSQAIVSPTCPLIRQLVRTFQEKKIAPGFWRSSEKLEALGKTAEIVDHLRGEFEKICCENLKFSKAHNAQDVFAKICPLTSDLKNIFSAVVHLPPSDSTTLFTRFFFGDFWLKEAFSPQDSVENFFSHDDLIFDKSKMANLIASALNSEMCMRTKMLCEAVWIQTLRKQRYLPVILPDQIPYRYLEIAQQTVRLDQYNLLSLSNGWAGAILGAAAWAHRHPEIQVNLVNCDQDCKITQAQSDLRDFLKGHFQLPNFRSDQISGTWGDSKILKKAQDLLGAKGRIVIGSLPALNRHLFQKQIPDLNQRLDESKLYTLWRRHCLEAAITYSSLFLHSSSGSSMAFWHVAKNIRKIDANPLSDSAQIWINCGLQPLAILYVDTLDLFKDEKLSADEAILVLGSRVKMSSQEFGDRLTNSLARQSRRDPTTETHPITKRSLIFDSKKPIDQTKDSPDPNSAHALAKRWERSAAFTKKAKDEISLGNRLERPSKRSFDTLQLSHSELSKTKQQPRSANFSTKTTPKRKLSSIAMAPSEDDQCLPQSIDTVGPLQNQLSIYPSRRNLFSEDEILGPALPQLNLARDPETPLSNNSTTSASNRSGLSQVSLREAGADQSIEDGPVGQNGIDSMNHLGFQLDPYQSEFSDYLHKDRVEADNIKKLKEVYTTLWRRIKHTYNADHPEIVKNFDEMMTKYPNRYKNYRARTYREIKKLPTLCENNKLKNPENHCVEYFTQCFRERCFARQLPSGCASKCGLVKNKQQKYVICGREFS